MERPDATAQGMPIAGSMSEAGPPLEGVGAASWRARSAFARAWSLAIFLALVAALLIRALFFEAFRIPSESMERTLQVGDFVLVSKLHYGPRLPITIGLPFTRFFLRDVELTPRRLPGFSDVNREDVIVFNVPTEPDPIDRKTHYIKRVIGLPGDTLSIINKVPFAGGEDLPLTGQMQQKWRAFLVEEEGVPSERLENLGVSQVSVATDSPNAMDFEATLGVAEEVATWPEVRTVKAFVHNMSFHARVFPYGSNYGRDNYGPLYVPARGDTLHLTAENWSAYQDLISRYEGHSAHHITGDLFTIDGKRTDAYVVEQDYYFVMGDNRDSSVDSRAWGFVPHDHVVGKAILIYFSWDVDASAPRADRILRRIE